MRLRITGKHEDRSLRVETMDGELIEGVVKVEFFAKVQEPAVAIVHIRGFDIDAEADALLLPAANVRTENRGG